MSTKKLRIGKQTQTVFHLSTQAIEVVHECFWHNKHHPNREGTLAMYKLPFGILTGMSNIRVKKWYQNDIYNTYTTYYALSNNMSTCKGWNLYLNYLTWLDRRHWIATNCLLTDQMWTFKKNCCCFTGWPLVGNEGTRESNHTWLWWGFIPSFPAQGAASWGASAWQIWQTTNNEPSKTPNPRITWNTSTTFIQSKQKMNFMKITVIFIIIIIIIIIIISLSLSLSLFLSLISCLSPTRKISHFPFTHSTPKPSVAGIRVDSKDEMLRSDTTTNANDVEAPWWHPENHPWNKRGWGVLIHSDWIPSRSLTNCPWKGYAVGNCKGWKIITGIQFQWWSKIWKMKAHLLKLTLSFWFLNQVLKNLGFNSHKNWGWWWRRWRWCIS